MTETVASGPEYALTMPELFARARARFERRPAIKEGELGLTYGQLDDLRRQAAKALLTLNVERGERVAVWAPNMYQYIAAAAAIESIGAVLVPINTRYKGAEAADLIGRGGIRILFTVNGFLGTDYPALLNGQNLPKLQKVVLLSGAPEPARPEQFGWQAFLALGAAVADAALQARMAAVTPDDPQDVLFTSGTTGRSKGVITTHRQNLLTYRSFSELLKIDEQDRYLIINPFFHAFGYKAGWLSAIMRGACIVPMAVFDVDKAMALIQSERITLLPGPPTIFQSLLASPNRAQYDLSSLKKASTGAAVIPVELIRRMYEELRFELVMSGFGMTETCGTATLTRPNDDPSLVANTVGPPIPGVEVKIVDAAGKALPAGEAGEVLIRGFNVMKGYLDDPQATAQAIDADGWLHSGDIGVLRANGYLSITDRLKDMLIVGGFNVYPAEIENQLVKLPGVAQAAVIGVPDERMGEVAKAFVVRRADATLDEATVIAWCREHLANFKVPRTVEFLDALPLNASNKVLKTELRKL